MSNTKPVQIEGIVDFVKGEPLFNEDSLAEQCVANQPFQHAVVQSFGDIPTSHSITIKSNVWFSSEDIEQLKTSAIRLTDSEGRELAVSEVEGLGSEIKTVISQGSIVVRYAWDLLEVNERIIAQISESRIEAEVSPLAVLDGHVVVGKGSQILPGVYIEGNVIIGDHCKVGPNCYIRGNTAIGNHCHVGNAVEVKNSMIGSHSNVGHLSYVGDSIIGDHSNLGAGTIISNYRHDKANHRSMVEGELVDTGRRKFGAVFGEGVFTGINTSVYPGRKISEGCSTLPGTIVKKDI